MSTQIARCTGVITTQGREETQFEVLDNGCARFTVVLTRFFPGEAPAGFKPGEVYLANVEIWREESKR